MNSTDPVIEESLLQERWALLQEIDDFLEKPLIILSLVWVALTIIEITEGLTPMLTMVSNVIWGIFIMDFAIALLIAPDRLAYIKRNWLGALAIALPAFRALRLFRVFRLLRFARVSRSLSLLKVLATSRRGMSAIRETLGRRAFGYVVLTTVMLTFLGAAGIFHLENPKALAEAGYPGEQGLNDYGDALWWTAMLMTTIGSEYWPQTPEGRLLTFLLGVYAASILGYIAATLSSHFIRTDQNTGTTPGESSDASS